MLFALLLASCNGQRGLFGAEEPFRVRDAQFFEGPLPGTAPLPRGTPFDPGDPPRVNSFSVAGTTIPQGLAGKAISGYLTTNAWSAGLALQGIGSGWWMVPAGDLDATTGSLTVSAKADFAADIATGRFSLLMVALDEKGVAGPQSSQNVCIASNSPAGSFQCGAQLPAAAITLSWDTQVDLDLQVLAPDGTLVTPKHPWLHTPDKNATLDLNQPHIDRDSNQNCVIDGARRESLIWPTLDPGKGETEVPAGLYGLYVNLFSPCGQQAVHYHLQVTAAAPAADTGEGGASDELTEKVLFDRSGELIASQTNPTDATGLFVGQYEF